MQILYIFFCKVNGYFEEINENKHLMLVPTNENKEEKKIQGTGIKIRHLIRPISSNSYYYNEKCIKFKI